MKKPSAKIHNTEKENKFIFNNIKVVNSAAIRPKKFRESANSELKKFHAQYYYSAQEKEESKNTLFGNMMKEMQVSSTINKEKLLDKLICVKLPKELSNPKKIKHEKMIVEQLKNSASGYLFKYYVCEQAEFPFKGELLMDSTDRPNLNEYLV